MASGAIDLLNVLVPVTGIIVNMSSERRAVVLRVPVVRELRKRLINIAEWISMGGFGDWSRSIRSTHPRDCRTPVQRA